MLRINRAHLTVAIQSHPGMTGKNNEDSFGVSAFRIGANNPTPVLFAIVSDGIGGHRAGEVASEMTVDIISQEVAESDAGQPIAIFQKAFYDASEAVWAKAQETSEHDGMGATCACALIVGDRLYLAWAGDSRIYLVRSGLINRLTRDHTWIQEALDRGIIKPEQAAKHPNQHVIRRYIGSDEPPTPDLRLHLRPDETDHQAVANQGMLLRQGDLLLLCTDGLTDLVTDDEILAQLRTRKHKMAAKILVDLANARGGHDNITLILLGVLGK
jgi:serine/threonine protein phosphatase PrpC